MKCQYCSCLDSKVIDSRPTDDGNSIRRRRECTNCGRRFTTYEKVELSPLFVVKRLPQFVHSRLRRMLFPSSVGRESITLLSRQLQY